MWAWKNWRRKNCENWWEGVRGKEKCHRGHYLSFVTFTNDFWTSCVWVLSFILVTRHEHILRSLSFTNWVTVTYYTLAWFVVKISWCLHSLYYVFATEHSLNNHVVRTFIQSTRSSKMMELLSGHKNFCQKIDVEIGYSVTCTPTHWVFLKKHAHIFILSTSAVAHVIGSFPHFHFP